MRRPKPWLLSNQIEAWILLISPRSGLEIILEISVSQFCLEVLIKSNTILHYFPRFPNVFLRWVAFPFNVESISSSDFLVVDNPLNDVFLLIWFYFQRLVDFSVL